METELGTAEKCKKCKGKALVETKLCGVCEGTGMIETVIVTKTVKRPYGKCKFPEMKATITEKRGVLTEREGDSHSAEEGDFMDRLSKMVNAIIEKREKDSQKLSSKKITHEQMRQLLGRIQR